MSDTSSGGGISVSPDLLREKVSEIAQLDEQLDAASGSETAGKRALGNRLAEQYESDWSTNADNLVSALKGIEDPEKLAGVFKGIIKSLNDNFSTSVDEYLAEQVKAQEEIQTEKPSDEQVAQWTQARKDLMEEYKALAGILKLFKQDISGIPEPKKRTGARGKRGKRVFQGFDWFIDGEPRPEKSNTLSNIANTVCAPLGWKTPELRQFLADQGIDLEHPPSEFEVDLPDPVNKKLSAKLRTPSLADDDEEVEEDDELEEDDDNGTE
jgi:hypothetical protein